MCVARRSPVPTEIDSDESVAPRRMTPLTKMYQSRGGLTTADDGREELSAHIAVLAALWTVVRSSCQSRWKFAESYIAITGGLIHSFGKATRPSGYTLVLLPVSPPS